MNGSQKTQSAALRSVAVPRRMLFVCWSLHQMDAAREAAAATVTKSGFRVYGEGRAEGGREVEGNGKEEMV